MSTILSSFIQSSALLSARKFFSQIRNRLSIFDRRTQALIYALLFGLLTACGGGGGSSGGGGGTTPAVTTITVSPASANIATGATQQFTAVVLDQNGATMTGVTLTWASATTSVATIASTGLATGVQAGTSNITASASGVTSAARVLTVTATSTVTGTAATGAAIANATVTIKDSAGTTRTTTTNASGVYTGDISGLVPPLLIQVNSSGTLYFSVSNASSPTVINVSPLTDLIIRSWYEVQGTTVVAAFAAPAGNPAPTPQQVAFIANVVKTVVSTWLTNAGLDPTNFDLISTPFTANGTGFDSVLDDTTVTPSTGVVSITSGTTTQTSTISVNGTTNSIGVSTTVTSDAGNSSSQSNTTIPANNAEITAINSINSTLQGLVDTVTSRGALLAASDLLPYLALTTLDQGLNQTQLAGNVASTLRGLSVTTNELSLTVSKIHSIDLIAGQIYADLVFKATIDGASQGDTSPTYFYNEAGTWKWAGNQARTEYSINLEHRIDYYGNQATQNYQAINVDARSLKDEISSVTISGGGIWDDTDVPKSGITAIDEDETAPGVFVSYERDSFFITSNSLNPIPAPGTQFTLTLHLAGGGTLSYTEAIGGSTTEDVTLTGLAGHSLANATLGSPITVGWNLPTTFPITQIKLNGQVFTDVSQISGFSCDATDGDSDGRMPLGSTSGQVTFPEECNGEPVLAVNINFSIDGENGERIQLLWNFQ